MIGASVVGFVFVGCNSLLDNEAAVLEQIDAGTVPVEASSDQPAGPSTASPPGADGGEDPKPSAECQANQQMCFGSAIPATPIVRVHERVYARRRRSSAGARASTS